MKTILLTLITSFGIWAAAVSVSAQTTVTNGAFMFTPIPLTNQVPFTNALVSPTNELELSNVVTLLLTLETNVELTIPALDFLQTNAVVISATNTPNGFAFPMTSLPPSLGSGLLPTGSESGFVRPQPTSLALLIGTNNFDIDPATLQAIFVLRNQLARALPTLQSLNGTPPTNNLTAPFVVPPVTTFSPGPLTNNLHVPLTNFFRGF